MPPSNWSPRSQVTPVDAVQVPVVILALLASLAEQSDISFEQKEKIIDKMIAIVQLKGNKDTETKKFKYKLLALLTGLLSVLALALLASLGGKAELHEGSEDEDEEN